MVPTAHVEARAAFNLLDTLYVPHRRFRGRNPRGMQAWQAPMRGNTITSLVATRPLSERESPRQSLRLGGQEGACEYIFHRLLHPGILLIIQLLLPRRRELPSQCSTRPLSLSLAVSLSLSLSLGLTLTRSHSFSCSPSPSPSPSPSHATSPPLIIVMLSAAALPAFALLAQIRPGAAAADVKWHAPAQSSINNLTSAVHGSGVYGFIYNSSATPDSQYGTYNWCNMPHVRDSEYVRPGPEFELQYVELVRPCPFPARPIRAQPCECLTLTVGS